MSNGDVALQLFSEDIRRFTTLPDCPHAVPLLNALLGLENLSQWLREKAVLDANAVGSACVEYLQIFGYVAYGYMWARMAHVSQGKRHEDENFHGAKLATATFYFNRLLPRIASLEASIRAGSESLYEMQAQQF